MSEFKRRKFLKTSAGVAAGAAAGPLIWAKARMRRQWTIKPEKGAKLRVLRWSRFVQGDIDQYMANVKKFTDKYRHRGARRQRRLGRRAAEGGGRGEHRRRPGHHPVDQRRRQPVSGQAASTSPTSATYLGKKYGGWYPAVRGLTCKPDGKKWIGVPLGAAGAMMVYRESMVKAAGFDTLPEGHRRFPEAVKALKAKGTPGGFALGNATGDGLLVQLAGLGVRRQARRRRTTRS